MLIVEGSCTLLCWNSLLFIDLYKQLCHGYTQVPYRKAIAVHVNLKV